jgi:hypothetical protein
MKEDDADDKTCKGKRGMTRRGFLGSLGLGAAAATLSGKLLSMPPSENVDNQKGSGQANSWCLLASNARGRQ